MKNRKSLNERGGSHRKDEELLFGIRPLIEAIKAGKEIDKAFIQNGLGGELIAELKNLIKKNNIVYQYVPVEKLNRLTRGNHQGIVGFVSPVSSYSVEQLVPKLFEEGKSPLLLILDRITDVRNFGAIARTAECVGAHAMVIPSRGAAQINADAVKASAGALYKIPVCKEQNLKDTIEYLKESGVQIVACTEKTDRLYWDVDLSVPVALIIGSEEDGISPEYLKRADHKVKIPLMGEIASLNVSVATGIVLYEAIRQRI